MSYVPAIATLAFGILLGYLGQRSSMCFCGGIRDYYLMKDTWLVKGLLGFVGGAILGAVIFNVIGMLPLFPWIATKGLTAIPGDAAGSLGFGAHFIVTIIGGFGVGFLSIIQGGCPFRNYVMAGEGNQTAMAYVLGLAVGAVVFHMWVAPFVLSILA